MGREDAPGSLRLQRLHSWAGQLHDTQSCSLAILWNNLKDNKTMLSAVHGHKADRGFAKSSEDLVEDIGRRKTRRQHLPPTLSIWGSTASRPLPRSRGCVFISQVSFPSARRCRAARRLRPRVELNPVVVANSPLGIQHPRLAGRLRSSRRASIHACRKGAGSWVGRSTL